MSDLHFTAVLMPPYSNTIIDFFLSIESDLESWSNSVLQSRWGDLFVKTIVYCNVLGGLFLSGVSTSWI